MGAIQLRPLVGGHDGDEGHACERLAGVRHPQELRPLEDERTHRSFPARVEDRRHPVLAESLVQAALRVGVAVLAQQDVVGALLDPVLGVPDPEVELAPHRVREQAEDEKILVRRLWRGQEGGGGPRLLEADGHRVQGRGEAEAFPVGTPDPRSR